MKNIFRSLLVILILFSSTSAFAINYLGVVQGTLRNFNRNGHYCPNDGSRSCTGSKYNQVDFSKYRPISEVNVYLKINGIPAGFGSTDIYGNYQIGWNFNSDWGFPTTLTVETFLANKDARFQVKDSFQGTTAHSTLSTHRLYGTTTPQIWSSINAPQNLGNWNWGTANAPIEAANTYESVWRTWNYAFRHSNRLLIYFHDLQVGNEHSFSRAHQNPFRINIGAQRRYGLVYHEMGHAAQYRASHNVEYKNVPNATCWPNQTCSTSLYSMTSQEWGSKQFSEAMATFLGNVSAFWSSSHDPIYCSGHASAFCVLSASNTYDLETSLGSACTTADSRRIVNAIKYFRDAYDQGDTVDLNFAQMIDGIYDLGGGTWNGQKNEPWNSSLTVIDDYDGRSARDFEKNIRIANGLSVSASDYIFDFNCTPVGD